MGETDRERDVLEELASRSADALDAYARLMELASVAEDWAATLRNAQRVLAVNPLQTAVHRHVAAAADHLNDRPLAIEAYRALLLMDPVDPAQAHYRLALLLHQQGDQASARRHVLQALEEAPLPGCPPPAAAAGKAKRRNIKRTKTERRKPNRATAARTKAAPALATG